jgi:hydrogenase/urease accessory protein HupE
MFVSIFRIMRSALRLRWLVNPVLLVAAMSFFYGNPACAHEIGTTRVSTLFHEGRTFEIEIVTDATALADKLEASSGQPSPGDKSPASLQRLFTSSDESFRQRVKIVFDGTEVRPVIVYSVAPGNGVGASAVATIRLSGQIPPGAHSFTWNYSWTFASYAMMVRSAASQNPVTEWLEGGQSSAPFALESSAPSFARLSIVWRYLTLGFTHILPNGFDHMLFVIGIYLLSGRARAVLTQVSAFTVAHSMTLGLSMYGIVTVSPRVVEPMIALSIAYVAIENIFVSELKSWRIALVFGFGLLHGMGFAGALKELGLPRSEFVTALLTFNVGVEAGHLAVIGAVFLLIGWRCSNRAWYRSRIVVPASSLIACVAVYWTIARVFV